MEKGKMSLEEKAKKPKIRRKVFETTFNKFVEAYRKLNSNMLKNLDLEAEKALGEHRRLFFKMVERDCREGGYVLNS
jgi:CRISPR/Cas system CMR subunit Cmr6 (Cas7 group RAMP superfamily)